MGQFVELLVEIGFLQPALATPSKAGEAPAVAEGGRGGGGKGGRGGGKGGKGGDDAAEESKGASRASSAAAVRALMRQRPIGGEYYNVHADSTPCLRAVLCAGL